MKRTGMKLTDLLRHEHDLIFDMILVMDAICCRIDAGEGIDPASLAEVVDFFRNFADGCHHAKEEHILFPALEASGVPREGGAIGAMLREHEIGRALTAGMERAVCMMRRGEAGAARDFRESARRYIELLVSHIAKENNVLYAMADRCLSPEDTADVREGFDRVERDGIVEGEDARYYRLLDRLRIAYLGG